MPKLAIRDDSDIVMARSAVRELAKDMGFSTIQAVEVQTAVSEVTRNILNYAREGMITIEPVIRESEWVGILVVAEDKGPGIEDVDLAMKDFYSTSGGLGLGLPGSKRLMDAFEIQSQVGVGTTIRMIKWRSP